MKRVTCCCGVLLRGNYVHFWNKSSCCCSDNPAFQFGLQAARPLKDHPPNRMDGGIDDINRR